ncbi:MAG: hypothetical protein EA424_04215, partial [Planctomycetaceae bacterium]
DFFGFALVCHGRIANPSYNQVGRIANPSYNQVGRIGNPPYNPGGTDWQSVLLFMQPWKAKHRARNN